MELEVVLDQTLPLPPLHLPFLVSPQCWNTKRKTLWERSHLQDFGYFLQATSLHFDPAVSITLSYLFAQLAWGLAANGWIFSATAEATLCPRACEFPWWKSLTQLPVGFALLFVTSLWVELEIAVSPGTQTGLCQMLHEGFLCLFLCMSGAQFHPQPPVPPVASAPGMERSCGTALAPCGPQHRGWRMLVLQTCLCAAFSTTNLNAEPRLLVLTVFLDN